MSRSFCDISRWKRAIDATNEALGFAVGEAYVAQTFPPEAKQRAEKLVADLKTALRARIAKLDWMAPSTKQAAGLLEDRRGGSVLLLLGPEELVAAKSFRNLSRVNVLPAEAAGVADIVGAATLVATQEAIDALTVRGAKAATKEASA